MIKVKLPEGSTSCSWGGEEYSANKKGIAKVPAEAVADLRSHGIVLAEEAEEAAEAQVEEVTAPAAQ